VVRIVSGWEHPLACTRKSAFGAGFASPQWRFVSALVRMDPSFEGHCVLGRDDDSPDNIKRRLEETPSDSEGFGAATEGRRMSRYKMTGLVAVIACAIAIPAAPALAGHGGGKASASSASCSVSGNTVSAGGLPTGVVINFMVSDSSGTSGWVLGISDNGNWSVNVPSANGPTTYQFVSATWGPNGSKYDVYASCSA
jgi:hypothetical protein